MAEGLLKYGEMRASKADRHKLKKLAPFAELYQSIYSLVGDKSIRQMKHLLSCCDVPSSSNCGWATFNVSPILRDILEEEIKVKEYAAKKAKNEKRRKAPPIQP
jgi:hypothetical protein